VEQEGEERQTVIFCSDAFGFSKFGFALSFGRNANEKANPQGFFCVSWILSCSHNFLFQQTFKLPRSFDNE